jgi:excisionase family DNA binding protein
MPRPAKTFNSENGFDAEVTAKAPLKFNFSVEGMLTLFPNGKLSFTIKSDEKTVQFREETLSTQSAVLENGSEKLAYSIKEVTRIFPISRSTLYREISEGRLKIHRIGMRRTIILKEELNRWLRSRA